MSHCNTGESDCNTSVWIFKQLKTKNIMITDFRLNEKGNLQVNVSGKWHNLVTFSEDCPYGKYGYKMTGVNKAFNNYMFFKNEDVTKIEAYLKK